MLVSTFRFNDAEIFTDPMFDMNHIVAGLDIGASFTFLFLNRRALRAWALDGCGKHKITFGDDRDLFMGIICAMDYAEVKLKDLCRQEVEFLKPTTGSFGFKIEVVYVSILGF